MRLSNRLFVPFVLVALSGCGDDSPQGTVETFLEACEGGDRDDALACLIQAERSGKNLSFNPDGVKEGYSIGSATITGNRASVPVTMGAESQEIAFVVLREEGEWRISLQETMRALLGFGLDELEESFQDMAEEMAGGMEEAMRGRAEGMAEAMQEGMRKTDGKN